MNAGQNDFVWNTSQNVLKIFLCAFLRKLSQRNFCKPLCNILRVVLGRAFPQHTTLNRFLILFILLLYGEVQIYKTRISAANFW